MQDPDEHLSGGGTFLRESFDLNKGPKTKEGNISESAKEAKDEAGSQVSEAGEKVSDAVEEAANSAKEALEGLKDKVSN